MSITECNIHVPLIKYFVTRAAKETEILSIYIHVHVHIILHVHCKNVHVRNRANLRFDEDGMVLEEGAEEESQVLNKVLLIILSILVCLSDVCHQRQHLVDRRYTASVKAVHGGGGGGGVVCSGVCACVCVCGGGGVLPA